MPGGDLVGAAMTAGESTPRPEGGGERGWADRSIVERAVRDFKRGEDRERNFARLFHAFRPRVERFLACRVFSPEERLDLTQTIFLRIYQGLEGYRGEGSLEGWLLQITFNVYRKWRDRQPGGPHAVPEVSLDLAAVPEPRADLPAAADSASPLDQVVRRERLEALREAISQLPPQQRLSMELRVYQERSVKEIAVALRISPETVKAHLFQARQKLWDKLHGSFGEIDF
jgi:RNA polymerase sigma-70 factor (ECF subfamily)